MRSGIRRAKELQRRMAWVSVVLSRGMKLMKLDFGFKIRPTSEDIKSMGPE